MGELLKSRIRSLARLAPQMVALVVGLSKALVATLAAALVATLMAALAATRVATVVATRALQTDLVVWRGTH